ncbi:MAG: precorrin-2 C(20)-methyltransferase [Candidatus Brocadiales bacterium]
MSSRELGNFYGIGIGPGDPELLTLKAIRILREVDVVFVPKADIKEESMALRLWRTAMALEIARPLINRNDKKVIEKVFPMIKDEDKLREFWLDAARAIKEELVEGKDVAFLTIGDSLTFSTYIYLLSRLRDMIPEEKIHTIPGITSFNAAASLVNLPLAQRDERLAVIPVSDDVEKLRPILEDFDTVVLMKVAKKLDKVIALLEELGLAETSVFASHVGLENAYITHDLSKLKDSGKGYMSVIIVKNSRKQAWHDNTGSLEK